MKKLYIVSFLTICLVSTNHLIAQKAEKQKADTTQKCKPSKSGKHCSKPGN